MTKTSNQDSLDQLCRSVDAPSKPLLVVISGPSGVGKDAVLTHMRRLARPCHFVVTLTTRPMRPGEVEGRDYFFTTRVEFQRLIEQGELLEWANVYGNFYGVPRTQVRQALAAGKDVLVRTDVQGAAHIRAVAPEATLVFLVPPSMAELERRLRERKTDSADAIDRRIQAAYQEMETIPSFDYVVINHTEALDATVRCIEAIMLAEKCRVRPRVVEL